MMFEQPEPNRPRGLDMYFDAAIAASFAEREQNEKNFRVAAIVDRVIMKETGGMADPLACAELGGGAHPDRYHHLFARLLKQPQGYMDWVDVSPHMLKLAEKYLNTDEYRQRRDVLRFVPSDIVAYLAAQPSSTLDLAIMKYTFDHISDLSRLYGELHRTLKPGGRLVASIGVLDPQLKSVSTNARFLYNGQEFPVDETRQLKDGDTYTVKFFNVSGHPEQGYLPGAETMKYYHSREKVETLAADEGFDVRLGDWKDFVAQADREGETMDQLMLVLKK